MVAPAMAGNGDDAAAAGNDAVVGTALDRDAAGAADDRVVRAALDQHIAAAADNPVPGAGQPRRRAGAADDRFRSLDRALVLVARVYQLRDGGVRAADDRVAERPDHRHVVARSSLDCDRF